VSGARYAWVPTADGRRIGDGALVPRRLAVMLESGAVCSVPELCGRYRLVDSGSVVVDVMHEDAQALVARMPMPTRVVERYGFSFIAPARGEVVSPRDARWALHVTECGDVDPTIELCESCRRGDRAAFSELGALCTVCGVETVSGVLRCAAHD